MSVVCLSLLCFLCGSCLRSSNVSGVGVRLRFPFVPSQLLLFPTFVSSVSNRPVFPFPTEEDSGGRKERKNSEEGTGWICCHRV